MQISNLIKRPVPFYIICIIVMLCMSSGLYGQDQAEQQRTEEGAAPEEPEVELPTVVLEYAAIKQESIETELPEGDIITLPTIEELLPEAGALEVSAPDLLATSPEQPLETQAPPASFFSEGVIGGGSDNHLIGDIALYKRGDFPLYQFRFSHEGIDGYGNNAAGTGYFDRREELSGKVELRSGLNSGTVNGSYFETETGLQGFDAANSVIHRFIRGSGSYTRSFESPFSLSAEGTAHTGSQLIGMQDEEEELFVESLGAGVYENKNVFLKLSGGYRYQQAPRDQQIHQGWAEVLTKFYFNHFDIRASGGSHWDTKNGFLFPWNLEIDGVAGDLLYRIGGGYAVEQVLYRQLWNTHSLLDTSDQLNLRHGWEGYARFGYTPVQAIRLTADAEWQLKDGIVVPDNLDERDPATGLFPFMLDERQLIGVQTLLAYYPNETVTLEGGWNGQLSEEIDELRPAHLIKGKVAYANRDTGFSVSMDGIYEISELPEMRINMSYFLSEGIKLVLEGNDLLSPFYDDGRPWWGAYEQRGLNVTLKTEISL